MYNTPQTCRMPVISNIIPSIVENSVEPDQLASEKPADLGLDCFQNRIYPGYSRAFLKH